MDTVILGNIQFKIDTGGLMRKLFIKENSEDAKKFADYVDEALKIGKPKIMYGPAYIESRGDDFVLIDDIKFQSRVLSVNLENTHRVFPYVATCGMELQNWAGTIDDMLERYWVDMICQAALECAIKELYNDIEKRYNPGKVTSMNPGSLEDWPIGEQKKLFKLLGSVDESIGVKLTGTFLMMPVKSVSGMLFSIQWGFESCQLCPRQGCPNRRAEYDRDLYNNRYK